MKIILLLLFIALTCARDISKGCRIKFISKEVCVKEEPKCTQIIQQKSCISSEIWVADQKNGEILIYDSLTLSNITSIKNIGNQPIKIFFDHQGEYAYVLNKGEPTVTVINTLGYKIVNKIKMESVVRDLNVHPNGMQLWLCNKGSSKITEILIDKRSGEYEISKVIDLGLFKSGASPRRIQFTNDGKFVFISLKGDGVIVLDSSTLKIVKILSQEIIGEGKISFKLSGDGREIFITSSSKFGTHISVFDTERANMNHKLFIEDYQFRELDFTNDGVQFWAVDKNFHQVLIFNISTFAFVDKLPFIGEYPKNLIISKDGQYAFSTLREKFEQQDSTPGVSVIDTKRRHVDKIIGISGDPNGIASNCAKFEDKLKCVKQKKECTKKGRIIIEYEKCF